MQKWKHDMSYWVGYRVYDPEVDLKPGAKCLLGPFSTRQEAKEEKHKNRGANMLQTDIFEANSEEEAVACLENEPFSKI
jgi:hypothetical protein